MKIIGKSTIPLLLIMILVSCNSFSTPSARSPTGDMKTAMSIVRTEVLNTAFYTPTHTATPTLTRIPMTATVTAEPTPFTSFDTVFVHGVNSAGENIHGNPYGLFHNFTVQASEFASFHFIMQITAYHFIKDQRTPTPTALPTETWKISIYRYQTDGNYINQPAIETDFTTEIIPYPDKLLMFMTADVSMEAIQTKFGDCSAFTYQVIDEKGKVQQQGNFSINPHLLFSYGGGLLGNMNDGITLGFPYSLNEKETEFFHQAGPVIINEPKSGFYRLTYMFNFVQASGVSATSEQEALASKLTIGFFPYRKDGKYSMSDSYPVAGNVLSVGGIYIVELPIDYLSENNDGNNTYYLQIKDDKGNTIKDESFVYVPYAP